MKALDVRTPGCNPAHAIQNTHPDFPASDAALQAERQRIEQADKAFATLRARMALAGFAVHIVTGDDGKAAYMVSRWNLNRMLPDVAAVRAFAQQVGASHA